MRVPRRKYALALAAFVFLLGAARVRPAQAPFPFSIAGGGFLLDGRPVFLNMISYQPLEPGQAVDTGAIRLSRITDDLRRLRIFRGTADPLVLRVYEQPTAQLQPRLPKAFYDGVRDHGFWVVRDIYFDPDFTSPDAISRGRAAIDRVIAEVEAAGAFDRIFAWEIGNEFAADGSNIPVLESFLGAMRNHIKARMAEPGRESFSNWVTWASWPMSDPLRTERLGDPIRVPSLDYLSFNAYSYDPERMRDHQAGHGTGTPFGGYLAALKSAFPNVPVVLTETGLPDSLSAIGENQARIPPHYPSYRRGALTSAQVAEGIADRYWDARLSGMAGFQIFQWADGWYKAGDPASHSADPEESFGLCRFVTAPAVQLRCKLQFWTMQTLYALKLPAASAVISGLAADSAFLTANGTTTIRAQLATGAAQPVRFRWETTRGRIVGDGPTVEFVAGGQALGPAVVTVVAVDADSNATRLSTTIEVQQGAPSLELITFGRQRSSGRVANVDLTQYKVVLYVHTNQYYVQPFADMTSLWITGRGYFWSSNFVATDAASVHAWLVPRSYHPPATMSAPPTVAIAADALTTVNDNDNDLLPDSLETNPTLEDRYSDPDADGAVHLDELLRGTDLHAADNDSDADGLGDDWEERFFGTLAYQPHQDLDADGLTNAAEAAAGTHPGRMHVDRDGDGLPDLFELRRIGSLAQGPFDTNSGGITHLDSYELGIISPTISAIPDQMSVAGATVGPIGFSLGDDDTSVNDLLLSASSSNEALLPAANIVLGGAGSMRTVTLSPAPKTLGTTTVKIVVSDREGGAAAEAFLLTVTDALGNLQIATLSAPSTGAPDSPLLVTIATRNDGPTRVPPSIAKIWLSGDKTLGGDLLLSNVAFPALDAGKKHQVVANVAIPTVAPGQFYLIAQADADAAVMETNEGDNLKVRPLLLGPDLTVAMTLNPSSPTSTAPTTISVTTRNIGGGAAPPSSTRVYRSANGKIDASSVLLANFAVATLSPGAASTGVATVTLPRGTYHIIAVVDATGAVTEARETNNQKRVKKTVP